MRLLTGRKEGKSSIPISVDGTARQSKGTTSGIEFERDGKREASMSSDLGALPLTKILLLP